MFCFKKIKCAVRIVKRYQIYRVLKVSVKEMMQMCDVCVNVFSRLTKQLPTYICRKSTQIDGIIYYYYKFFIYLNSKVAIPPYICSFRNRGRGLCGWYLRQVVQGDVASVWCVKSLRKGNALLNVSWRSGGLCER